MDPTYEYLWAAGYNLPPEPAKEPPALAAPLPKRRKGRKARSK